MRDQVNGFLFEQIVGSGQPTFTPTGSCPSRVPSITSEVGLNKWLTCFNHDAVAIFEGTGSVKNFVVYHAYRRLGNDGTQRYWSVSNTGSNTEMLSERCNSGNDSQSFQVNGTGSISVASGSGPVVGEDQWSRIATNPTQAKYWQYDSPGSAASKAVLPHFVRGDVYHNITIFARGSLAFSNYADIETYAWIAFDRVLNISEVAIVTGALERLMGVSY